MATQIDLGIEGMTCAACVSRVEKVLKRVPGVSAAEVNLATNRARVTADGDVALAALTEAVERAGYAAVPVAEAKRAKPESVWPVVVSALLTLPLVVPMLFEPFGLGHALMLPAWALWPMIGLATVATVIASQAVISGAFSLANQGILLGFLPRMQILHTSDTERGQIYMPMVNWLLLVLVIFTVIQFRESGNLAAAYGISVTTTMLITTSLLAVVMYKEWKIHPLLVAAMVAVFFIVDFAFWTANIIKIKDGGWYPLMLGAICFVMLTTWYKGRRLLRDRVVNESVQLPEFVESLLAHPPHRVEGTAVFLTAHIDFVPVALLHNLKHNRVLHERVIFLKLSIWDVPYVRDEDLLTVSELGSNIFVVRAVHGFKETPDINVVLTLLEQQHELTLSLSDTSFFLARDTIVPSNLPGMALWRERLFAWMMQNAAKPSDFFRIPPNRVVELGTKIEI